MCHELDIREIVYKSQVELLLEYKGQELGHGYVIDLLVEENLIIEIRLLKSSFLFIALSYSHT